MQVQKPVWISDDGKEHDSEAAMHAHEGMTQNAGRIKSYLDSVDWSSGRKGDVRGARAALSARTRAENIIASFLGFEASGVAVTPDEVPVTEGTEPETEQAATGRKGRK
jgi:hypothetical protein